MISAIFACKLREAIISLLTERAGLLLSDAHWTEQMQSCVRTNRTKKSLDLSLVAFLEKKSLWGSKKTKSLSWQHCVHLYYSPLSLSDCSSTRMFKLTHTYRNIWNMVNQRRGGGVLPFTISDWIRPRYGPNVCLLLNHRETFRVAEIFYFSNGWSHQCDLSFFSVAPLRN